MAVYSINDIEKLCGIKAHTIRIWEKRYNIITPRRTETNIRYYLDEDLQKILNISLLNRNNYKISKIAQMTDSEMKTLVSQLSDVTIEKEDNLDSLMFAMLELDEYKFNKILDHNISSRGFEETMNEVVYPLMEKLSMMWVAGSIKGVHENFVANAIKRKMIVAIDSKSKEDNPKSKRALLYLPQDETHELSLLFMHFMLREMDYKIVNLGTDVPLIEVLEGQKIFKADIVCTLFNDSFAEQPLQPYLNELSKHLSGCRILISGYQTAIQNIEVPANITALRSIVDIKSIEDLKKDRVTTK